HRRGGGSAPPPPRGRDAARGAGDPGKSRRLLRRGDRAGPVARSSFVDREEANHPVAMRCRVPKVSASGYSCWRKRGQSARARADVALTTRIVAIHERGCQAYGAPRVHAELRALGLACGRKRVARRVRRAGLVGCRRRRSASTTRRGPAAPVAPDRVERRSVAAAPDVVWSADIACVPTREGSLYLA